MASICWWPSDQGERLTDVSHPGRINGLFEVDGRELGRGRPPYDPVLMFKVLVLQALYNLSDDQAEFKFGTGFLSCGFSG